MRNISAAFEAENDELFAAFDQENPYTVANYAPDPDEKPRQNLVFRDLMMILSNVLED